MIPCVAVAVFQSRLVILLKLSRLIRNHYKSQLPINLENLVLFQASLNWPLAHHFCGDWHEQAVPRSAKNIGAVYEKQAADGK